MKIEIEVDNLTDFINAFNNAYLAYFDVRKNIYLMGGVPENMNPIWEKLIGNNFNNLTEKFDKRLDILKNVYNQLLEKEN